MHSLLRNNFYIAFYSITNGIVYSIIISIWLSLVLRNTINFRSLPYINKVENLSCPKNCSDSAVFSIHTIMSSANIEISIFSYKSSNPIPLLYFSCFIALPGVHLNQQSEVKENSPNKVVTLS